MVVGQPFKYRVLIVTHVESTLIVTHVESTSPFVSRTNDRGPPTWFRLLPFSNGRKRKVPQEKFVAAGLAASTWLRNESDPRKETTSSEAKQRVGGVHLHPFCSCAGLLSLFKTNGRTHLGPLLK